MKTRTLATILILICWFVVAPSMLRAEETSGIKGSKDSGSGGAIAGAGKAPTAMIGIKGSKDTGTKSETAGNGTATTAMSIGRGPMAGNGTASGESTIRIVTDR